MISPKVGITGSRGVLGRSLLASWTEVEWRAFEGDLRQPGDIRGWLETTGPLDAIIHLAAMVPTQKVEADPLGAFQTNVAGTCQLLEALRLMPPEKRPWLFYASTSHVYRSSDLPLTENSPCEPITLYGRTKLQAEEWCRIYGEKYGLGVCMGRIFSYTSPLQAQSYFIPATIKKIREAPRGATLEIPGLLGSRDFLTTKEISRVIRELYVSGARGVFNIGSGHGQSLLEVAEALRVRLNREDVKIVPLEQGTSHLIADVSKLNSAGIRASCSLDGLFEGLMLDRPAVDRT
ncbi:MAG: NAD-dependent epimerase/dehydratase family protein [Bdellovibrionota bacterium]